MSTISSSIPQKRKTISDFFTPTLKRQEPTPSPLLQPAPNPSPPLQTQTTKIPGLTLISNFITPTEESSILSFLNDPSKCTWRTDLSRRTMHFGGTYCLMPPKSSPTTNEKAPPPKILKAPPIPPSLTFLISRLITTKIFPPSKRPQYIIVNEYTGTQGISAHTENFSFGEPVVGLSLLSAGEIRFHELTEPCDGSVRSGKAAKATKTGRKVDVGMPGRSMLVMRGESRWRWQHEVLRSARGRGQGWKRISLTFRWREGG